MEEQILEVASSLAENKLPVYYKYRYTFNKDEAKDVDRQKSKTSAIIKFIRECYLLGDKMTAGIEHYTKGMLSTKPHCHIHFISRFPADTIRKGIMRRFDLIGRCQSCKAEVIVDTDKFWRYPFKQQMNETKISRYYLGMTKDEADLQTSIAYECWKCAAQVLVGKLEKKAEKTSRERLFVYLDTLDSTNELEIVTAAYKYFVEHEEIFNPTTVNGYVYIYLLTRNIVTYEVFVKNHYCCL